MASRLQLTSLSPEGHPLHGGPLPTGLTIVDHGDSTATVSGTPPSGSAGNYIVWFAAQGKYCGNFFEYWRTNTMVTITIQP